MSGTEEVLESSEGLNASDARKNACVQWDQLFSELDGYMVLASVVFTAGSGSSGARNHAV